MRVILLFMLFFSMKTYGQIVFEKGNLVNNLGTKKEVLIKNFDWKDNPETILYKTNETSEVTKLELKEIKSFEIYGASKYLRQEVEIDRSSSNINYLSEVREAVLKKETLLLEVLLEGKASLYRYTDSNIIRYFYQKEGEEIKQLVHKYYQIKKGEKSVNNRYKQQLWVNLKCEEISQFKVESTTYKENSLLKLFKNYNDCSNSTYVIFDKKDENKKAINLTARLGVNSNSFVINNNSTVWNNIDFGSQKNLRVGLELEWIMPFNKDKWTLLLEPSFHQYRADVDYDYIKTAAITKNTNVMVDYKAIEIPVGLRHYMFLNSDSKFFVNASYVMSILKNKSSLFSDKTDLLKLEINSNSGVALGFGYKYKNKYSVEFRYAKNIDLLSKYLQWNSDYKNVSLIFGYTIF